MSGRAHRDLLAEAMRREALISTVAGWEDAGESGKEEWRRRADHVIRLLQDLAGTFRIATQILEEQPMAGILTGFEIVGSAGLERFVREDERGQKWSIVKRDRKTNEEMVEQTFTRFEIADVVTQVMSGDPRVQKRQAVGRLLAAAVNIYMLHAGAIHEAPGGSSAGRDCEAGSRGTGAVDSTHGPAAA